MKTNYSFLDDELALLEIRKHKWIESEKEGQEIGFATAAYDWIQKYGNDWRRHRIKPENVSHVFSERRSHRRFHWQFPVKLKIGTHIFSTVTQNINLVGFLCASPLFLPHQTWAEAKISFRRNDTINRDRSEFEFQTQVRRISAPKRNSLNLCYQIFLNFDEKVRDYLRFNASLFAAT